jgi:hypothetical protein
MGPDRPPSTLLLPLGPILCACPITRAIIRLAAARGPARSSDVTKKSRDGRDGGGAAAREEGQLG